MILIFKGQILSKQSDEQIVEQPVSQEIYEDEGNESAESLLASFKAQARKKIRLSRKPSLDKMSLVEFEINLYMSEAEADPSLNAIDCWITKRERLPFLSNIAQAVLAVPATSAPCERVFSQAAVILCKNRHNLSSQTFESEIFFKCNAAFL